MKGMGHLLKAFLFSSILSAMMSCSSRPEVRDPLKEGLSPIPYVTMELTPSTHFGRWTQTDLHIPKGAIVAVLARGEIYDVRDPDRLRWQPWNCLRFSIGEERRRYFIDAGVDPKKPSNLNVVFSSEGGILSFGMGAWFKMKDPKPKRGRIEVRILLWERNLQDRIETDLLALIRSYPKDQQWVDLVGSMALCLGNMGEYPKVLNLYRMLQENPEWNWERVYPIVLNQLSDFERKLGRYETARIYLEESSRRIKPFNNRHLEWLLLRRQGMMALNQKKHAEAKSLLEQALQLALAMGNPSNVGSTLNSLGLNALRMNQPQEAVAYLEEALKYLRKGDRHLAKRWTYLYLGEGYLRLNRPSDAQHAFQRSIEMALKAGDPEAQWSAHQWLGLMAEQGGDDRKTFEHYAAAITLIESMRIKYPDPNLKALFMRDKLRIYERMIHLLFKMKQASEAFHYVERARARVFLDMLSEKVLLSRDREESELLVQERALRRQMEEEASRREEKISEEPSQEVEEGEIETQEKGRAFSRFEQLQAQHQDLLKRIERLNPELASLLTINPLRAGEVQQLLDDDTALLEYFIGAEHQYLFLLTSQEVLMVPLRGTGKALSGMIREFRRRAVEGITMDRLLSRIYERPLMDLHEILIQPVLGVLSHKKHLVIVPHGMIHYLPFQALLSRDGTYLIERFTISYLPSASVLKYAQAKNRGNRRNLFAVGNPATGLPPLPAAEAEVKEVATLFEAKRILTGAQATKASVKGESPKFDHLLLSTHGEMIHSDPLRSNLRFAPSEKDDGRLTVHEIFDMEIQANLVTLSACETGLVKGEEGDFPQGDDLVGLSRAFIYAGAPSVVASLWKVSDDSTVVLMKRFYENMKKMSKAEALQKAQLHLMRSTVRFTVTRAGGGRVQPTEGRSEEEVECSHPFFWAPFILIGDWR